MAGDLTLETFAAQTGTTFTVRLGDADMPLTLTVARPAGEPAEGRRVPFALEFHGPPEPAFAQQTLTLEHPALGPLTIFLVPIARDADGTTYEAIFA